MKHSIEQMCEKCIHSRELQKSQPKYPFIEPQLIKNLSTMESVSTDLFEYKKTIT